MDGIVIRPMIEHAGAVPRIAAWFFEEWRLIYGGETQASVQRRIESWLTQRQIPTALVALSGNQVVGTVALKERELPQFPESPWLAGLYVVPEFRRHGIGALLVQAAEREAASLGVERLHLYTPGSQQFYARLGWSVLGHRLLPGGMVAVMCKQVGVSNVRH